MTLALVLIAGGVAIVGAHILILLAAMWGDRLTGLAIARCRVAVPPVATRLARLLPATLRHPAPSPVAGEGWGEGSDA